MLTDRLSHLFYRLVVRLIFCRPARDYEEHHGSTEDVYAARIGMLHFEISDCFVLDHVDAGISLRAQTPWGRVAFGMRTCAGKKQVRRPGLFFQRYSS